MNIIVLHGDNLAESNTRLKKFKDSGKSRGWGIVEINHDASLSLAESLTTSSLFEKERLFIFRDFRSLTARDFEWLNKSANKLSGNLVIYNESEIAPSFLKKLPSGAKTENFKLPKIIFEFLDSVYPGNIKNCLGLLRKVTLAEPVEFVFALFAKYMRDLFWVKVSPDSLPYPSWRKKKLSIQAEKFSINLLKEIISQAAEIDIDAKTSNSSLADSLDLLVVSKLE